MKKMILFCLVLVSSSAQADILFKFKDQSAHVWTGYYAKGNEYCTLKSFGEYCTSRQDVVSITTVPPGTEASEYGISTLGGSDIESTRDDNIKALDSLNCTQLRASTSRAAQEAYRNECLSRDQQLVWDEEQQRTESLRREAQIEEERVRHEEEKKMKRKEQERKAVPTRPRSTPN
jgi:hypothetical protein